MASDFPSIRLLKGIQMNAGQLCTRGVDTICPGDSVLLAARRMDDHLVGSLVVVQGEKPVGILTDRDLAVRVVAKGKDPATTLVADVMTQPVVTIPSEASLLEVTRKMAQTPCRRLVVLDAQGRMVGVISLDDVWNHVAQVLWGCHGVLEAERPSALAK